METLKKIAVPVAAIVAFLAILVVSVMIWRRSGGGRRVLMVEALRILGAALACITLLQPEIRAKQSPDRKPVLAILWDDSLSMATQDMAVKNPDGSTNIITRSDWVKKELEGKFWGRLDGQNTIVVEPFASGRGSFQEWLEHEGA